MTITIITDKERATHILNDGQGYYTAELFDPKEKMNPDQTGVKVTFPSYYNADMAALLMFHVGIKFGLDKGCEVLLPSYKPDKFKDISVPGGI